MNTRSILAAAAAGITLVAPAFAQQSEDAKAILADSAKAMKSVSGLTFHGKKSGTGMLKEIIDCEGDVKLWRSEPGKAPMVMVTGRIKQPAAADKNLTYMNDGTVARWLEQKDNSLYERSMNDNAAQQELNLAKQMVPDDYFAAEPFGQVMKMEKLTKLPNDNIKGEVCDIVEGSTADGTRTITWAFAVTDKLPRRMEMATGMADKKIAMILDMTEVKPGASLSAKDFDIAMPPGYVLNKMGDMPKSTNPGSPVVPDVELGLKPGVAAPAISVKDADGKDVSLEAMKGKVVVMEFFGTMFKASAVGSAEMQALSDEFKAKDVKFVGLACREAGDGAAAKEYFKANNLTYTLVPKGDAAVAAYNVKGFPSYYVIDPAGKVAAFYQQFPGKDVMASAINQAAAVK